MPWFKRSVPTVPTTSTAPACCSAHVALHAVDCDIMRGWYVECYHAHVHGADISRATLADDYSTIQFADGSVWRYGPRADGTYGYTAQCR